MHVVNECITFSNCWPSDATYNRTKIKFLTKLQDSEYATCR